MPRSEFDDFKKKLPQKWNCHERVFFRGSSIFVGEEYKLRKTFSDAQLFSGLGFVFKNFRMHGLHVAYGGAAAFGFDQAIDDIDA